MADLRSCAACSLFLCLINFSLVFSGPITIPVLSVSQPLIRSALNSLNEDSPTHHTYKGGNLISAQKLVESPYVVYRLTFDLNPVCKETLEACPREACTIEVKQHEHGDINVLRESIQCMYLYPQSTQDDIVQVQESIQEQDVIDKLDKLIVGNQSVELDHEIQENGDQNDRPFIAMRASSPNYCPGCPYELNPNLPGLIAFGDQIAQSMDEQIQNDYKHKVVRILKVMRAVPPASNVVQYEILLHLGESDCLKNAIVDQSECSVQSDLPVKTCVVTFEEHPWQQSSRRITKNNCTLAANVENEVSAGSYSEPVREALVTATYNTEHAALEKFNDALENLKDILENFTYATPTKVAEQDRPEVTEQSIVEVLLNRSKEEDKPPGFNDKIKEFGEFLEDFNLPIREAKSDSNVNKGEEVQEEPIVAKKVSSENSKIDSTHQLYRNKRGVTQVGAPTSKDINDPQVQEYVHKGLRQFSANSEGTNEPIIAEITDATVQVVSGLLYKISVKLGTSTCPKGVTENCQLKPDSEIKDCMFEIWSQPWLDKGSPRITINCELNKQKKRSLRGFNYNLKMMKLAEDIKNEERFEDFIKKYDKVYASAEEKSNRFETFKGNFKIIEELRRFERGTAEYGVTMFADLTRDEFKARYLGFRPDLKLENEIPFPEAEIPDVSLPPKFDWRDHNVVTPVKDQGSCGSCWAFSVTGNVEGQNAIKHGKLLSLSEQELLDCDKLDEGCNGGLPDSAYRAIEALGGLELESDYPYDAKDEKCNFNKTKAKVQIVSAVNITSNETQMAQWLIKNGPIAIGINANAMQFYVGGVSHPFHFLCSPDSLDHGVLIVGYGVSKYPLFHKELPYWIIKNSWGNRWGEQGYYRVFRGDGTCGLNTQASSAIIA